MKEKVEEEKELPPIFKRQRYDVEPEVSAFDDEANSNFNTYRNMISARDRYNEQEKPLEDAAYEQEKPLEDDNKERKKIKRKKDRKDKKKKSKRRKKSKDQERAESQPLGIARKATVLVSKKILRQATERGQTLSQYVRENKLRLVAPSEKDLKKTSQQSSTKHISSIGNDSTKGPQSYGRRFSRDESLKGDYFEDK